MKVVETYHFMRGGIGMAIYKLKILPPTEERGVIVYKKPGPVMKGDGPDDYACPTCGNIIAKSVKLSDLTRLLNAAFKC